MRRYSSKNRKGFTLGEMLITVAIVAILSAVAIISVTSYLWNVRLLDADQAAKEVYLAAQYHLSLAKERGKLDQYSGKELGTVDQLYTGSEYENKDGGTLYDLVYSPGNDATKGIRDIILPQGSIDETMRTGGSYIITYDKDTATVVGVFYSYAGRSYGYSFTADTLTNQTSALKKSMTDRNSAEAKAVRKHFPDTKNRQTIGFYGGKDLPADKTDAPVLSIENGDTLSAIITLSKDQNKLFTANGYAVQLTIRGQTSGNTVTKVFDAQSADAAVNNKKIYQYAAVLDAWQDKKGTDGLQIDWQFHDAAKALIPGENITVTASIVKKEEDNSYSSVSKTSNSVLTNSMFGSLKQENGQNTVTISSIRHLENLAKIDAKALNIVSAKQVSDIDFSAYQKNMSSFFDNKDPDLYIYKPVNLANDLTYDAGYSDSRGNPRQYMLSDLDADGGGVFGGLEKENKLSVSNLQIIDINVKAAGGEPAGALLGNAKENTTVTADNILVWDKSATIGISAEADAGGLIGHSDGTVNITNTAVSAYVKSTGGNAGGLIGSASTLTVKASYVSAHTYQKDYVNELDPQTDKDSQHYNITAEKGNAGGIVGSVSRLDKLTDSYVTASIYGSKTANAFVSTVSDNTNYTNSKCYAVTVVNGTNVKEPSTFSGNADTKTKYVNDESLLDNGEATYPYPVVSSLVSNANAWFLKSHVGDWSASTSKEGKDIALVYYEKVAHTGADGKTVYNWYWHGYMQNLNSASSKNWNQAVNDPEIVFSSVEISTDNKASLNGNTVVNGILDDPDTGGYYVVEDGYVLMLKNSNSLHAKADQINVYYGGNTDYNMAVSGSIYEGFDEKLGYEGYTCYYLNTNNTVHWGEDNEFTIVLNPWNDSTRRAQFFINPYFANNISDKEADFLSGGKYYHNGDIRSARQLNQLFTDGAKFIADSYSGYNYVVSQTMDIDYSRTDFTSLGKPVLYQNETLSLDHGTGTKLSGIYQGADSDKKYYHKLIGLTQPMVINVLDKMGEIRYLDIARANISSLVSGKNAGSIHDISIENSIFSSDAIAQSGNNNGSFQNITITGTSIAENGIVGSNPGSQISNIQLINCQIGKNGVVETNSSTVSNITISSHSTIKGSGICSSNAGTISGVQIQNAVVEGNGIAETNANTISNITIRSDSIIKGSGICSSNAGTISHVNIQDSVIKGSGISAAHNSSISNITVDNCTIEGDGIVNKMTGGNIDTVSISHTNITGNGVATSSTGYNSKISNITITDSAIRGDGVLNTFEDGNTIDTVSISQTSITGNGVATSSAGWNSEVSNITMNDSTIGGDGFIHSVSSGVIHNITLSNVMISGNGFATDLGGRAVYACNIINAQIGKNGFAETFTGNNSSIVDCHIYADKDVYTKSTKTKFVLSEDSIGGVWNDQYNLYNLTVIGLQPNTKKLTPNMDSVSGFIGAINAGQLSIYGCSVTASIYGRGTVNGFADNLNNVQVKDSYVNAIITAGYGLDKNETVSNSSANGFARVVGQNSSINYCVSSGMILCDPGAVDQITASGFVDTNQGYITDSVSTLWYIQPSVSYVFAKNKGNWIVTCGYLYTEGVRSSKLTSNVNKYSASEPAGLSDRSGSQASADTTRAYYTFVDPAADGQAVYPYRVPHRYQYENNNITDKGNEQTWYGDWYQRGTTQAAMNKYYGLKVSIDPAEDDGKNNSGNNPSQGGGTENTGNNPAPAKISEIFKSNPYGMNLESGRLLQDDQGKYVLLYSTNHSYKPCNGTAEDFVANNPSNAMIIDRSTQIYKTPENGFDTALQAGTIARDGDNYYVLNYDQPYSQGWRVKPSQDTNAWSVIKGGIPTF